MSRLILALVGGAVLMAAGATAWHFTPWVGPAAVQAGLQRELQASRLLAFSWEQSSRGWERSFRAAEGLRAQERTRAENAVSADARACDARVAEARRATSAIHTIVTREVPRDAANCPVRELVPADQLRDLLARPAGAGGAASAPRARSSRLR